MKKLKIYLDTSVISHLEHHDTEEKKNTTRKLWKQILDGDYEVFLSETTMKEIGKCKEPLLSILTSYLEKIEFRIIEINEEILTLAEKFIEHDILTKKSYDDCQHIAAAIVCGVDVIVSWNFSHIVTHKTIQGVKVVSAIEGYRDLQIYSPNVLVEGEENAT